MSIKLMIKDNHTKATDQDDNLTPIVDVKCSKLSEREISDIQTMIFRRIRSENKIQSNVNYDDLCGSWIYPENPLYARYIKPLDSNLCVWKYFAEEDLVYLKKHQQNKDVICSFFANKFFVENVEKNDNILTEILWEFFKFARLHLFTEKGISGLLGVVYSTHIFFLSHPWLKAKDVYQFFYKTVLLHVVLDPPKSMEVFTVAECKLLFKAFHKMYIKNLVLFHILCHPHYYFTMNLHNLTSSVYNNE